MEPPPLRLACLLLLLLALRAEVQVESRALSSPTKLQHHAPDRLFGPIQQSLSEPTVASEHTKKESRANVAQPTATATHFPHPFKLLASAAPPEEQTVKAWESKLRKRREEAAKRKKARERHMEKDVQRIDKIIQQVEKREERRNEERKRRLREAEEKYDRAKELREKLDKERRRRKRSSDGPSLKRKRKPEAHKVPRLRKTAARKKPPRPPAPKKAANPKPPTSAQNVQTEGGCKIDVLGNLQCARAALWRGKRKANASKRKRRESKPSKPIPDCGQHGDCGDEHEEQMGAPNSHNAPSKRARRTKTKGVSSDQIQRIEKIAGSPTHSGASRKASGAAGGRAGQKNGHVRSARAARRSQDVVRHVQQSAGRSTTTKLSKRSEHDGGYSSLDEADVTKRKSNRGLNFHKEKRNARHSKRSSNMKAAASASPTTTPRKEEKAMNQRTVKAAEHKEELAEPPAATEREKTSESKGRWTPKARSQRLQDQKRLAKHISPDTGQDESQNSKEEKGHVDSNEGRHEEGK